jgi:tetratricopeptide (TPR) repeat protein
MLFAAILAVASAGECVAEVSRSQELRARVFKDLTDGIQAYKEGRPKDAIPLLEQAADVALNSFRAYHYLGLAYYADRQYRRALDPLEVALELDPVSLPARVALGDCHLKLGDPEEALAEYHRALALQQDYAPALDGLARTAEASGDVEKAIEHYRKAIALNPGFPDASLNLGDLFLREGRNQEATRLFLDAIRVRPDFAAAYNRLGVAYARQRLSNEAIAALRHAAALERGNPWHPVTIGGIFMDLDNLVQAEREFDEALRMDPDYLEAYMARATLLRRQGRLGEAVVFLDVGLSRNVEAPESRARLREMRDQYAQESEQLTTLQAALAHEGEAPEQTANGAAQADDPNALVALAQLRQQLGDHPEAVRLLQHAVDQGGASDPLLLDRLAYNQLRAGYFERAEATYEGLLAASPGNVDLLINLALSRIGLSDHAGAEEALREASRLRPGDARPLAYLGNVYVLSGRRDDAIRSLDASLALMEEQSAERPRIERLLEALRDGRAAQ